MYYKQRNRNSKDQKQMLEIKYTATKKEKAFTGCTSRFNMAKERTSELKNM